MGFHICKYCVDVPNAPSRFSNISSGDVTLLFENGNQWTMPDMILHYITDHGYKPPQCFIVDVLTQALAGSGRVQMRGMTSARVIEVRSALDVGYLDGPYDEGDVPAGFIEKLETLMKQAGYRDGRMATLGIAMR
jgi:hypothetical protein